MVASDGGVFAFGDARFEGSCPGIGGCSGAAVAVMPTPAGNGYWLVTQTGNVYAFGDAPTTAHPGTGSPVTSAVRTPDGSGYWILMAERAVFAYGDAASLGAARRDGGGFNPASGHLRRPPTEAATGSPRPRARSSPSATRPPTATWRGRTSTARSSPPPGTDFGRLKGRARECREAVGRRRVNFRGTMPPRFAGRPRAGRRSRCNPAAAVTPGASDGRCGRGRRRCRWRGASSSLWSSAAIVVVVVVGGTVVVVVVGGRRRRVQRKRHGRRRRRRRRHGRRGRRRRHRGGGRARECVVAVDPAAAAVGGVMVTVAQAPACSRVATSAMSWASVACSRRPRRTSA